jgi:hypothetical protein
MTPPHPRAYLHAVNKRRGQTQRNTAAEYLLVSGDVMNSFLNENWHLAYDDVGKDVSLAVGHMVFSIFKESAKTVPYNEIFDDVE